ncbi:MAG TPA: UrcA family protein [Vitreimonas sp.]|uniref:UrcA family protein n=1 Tax=Vitreimonas sp. TaxID=3069702 RepID=UPI002D268D68|nr:UrcA family protein [Vitreimonas sp.]HYD87244.1 UrcA family protein [Vitreimonas sp.]
MTRTSLALACAPALLLCAAAAPAFAQAAWDNRYESRVVYFGDLDLESRAGADTLIRRIEQASDIVCGDRAGPRPINEHHDVRGCEAETVEYAVREVGHPNVLYRYYGYRPEVVIEGDDDPYYTVKPRY